MAVRSDVGEEGAFTPLRESSSIHILTSFSARALRAMPPGSTIDPSRSVLSYLLTDRYQPVGRLCSATARRPRCATSLEARAEPSDAKAATVEPTAASAAATDSATAVILAWAWMSVVSGANQSQTATPTSVDDEADRRRGGEPRDLTVTEVGGGDHRLPGALVGHELLCRRNGR